MSMLANIDIANHEGSLRCYVGISEGGVHGTVTVLLKFGSTDDLSSSCLKLRFSAAQYRVFQRAMSNPLDFPGYDLSGRDDRSCECHGRHICEHFSGMLVTVRED